MGSCLSKTVVAGSLALGQPQQRQPMEALRGKLPLVPMCMWRVVCCTVALKRAPFCSGSSCAYNGGAGSTGTRGVHLTLGVPVPFCMGSAGHCSWGYCSC